MSPRYTCRWCGVTFIGWGERGRVDDTAVQRHADHTWVCPERTTTNAPPAEADGASL